MNESQQQKQPEKESFAIFGVLMVVIVLGLLAALLKIVGLF
jgi:hypothetical protein